MKKLAVLVIALAAFGAFGDTITNYVVVVSNIYNRVSDEKWVTNYVKNTHINYYFTNNVYVVTNRTILVSQTNVNTTVLYDVSQQAVIDARSQADRAAYAVSDAREYADAAARSATSAGGYSAEAQQWAAQAHAQVQPIIDEGKKQLQQITQEGEYQRGRVNSAGTSNVQTINGRGSEILGQIESRKSWFEQNFGNMVTNVYVSTNFYTAEAAFSVSANTNWFYYFCVTGSSKYTYEERAKIVPVGVSKLPSGESGCMFGTPYRLKTDYSEVTVYKYGLRRAVCGGGEWFVEIDFYDYNTEEYVKTESYSVPASGFPNIPQQTIIGSPSDLPDTVFWIARSTKLSEETNIVYNGRYAEMRDVDVVQAEMKKEVGAVDSRLRAFEAEVSKDLDDLKDGSNFPEKLYHFSSSKVDSFSVYLTHGGTKIKLYGFKVGNPVPSKTINTKQSYEYKYSDLYDTGGKFEKANSPNFGVQAVYYYFTGMYGVEYWSASYCVRCAGGMVFVDRDVQTSTPDAVNGWKYGALSVSTYSSPVYDIGGESVRLTRENLSVEYDGEKPMVDYVISSDFGVYNADGTKIGRVLTHEDFSSLSNWVERVFMKK